MGRMGEEGAGAKEMGLLEEKEWPEKNRRVGDE